MNKGALHISKPRRGGGASTRSAQLRNTAQALAQRGAKMQGDHCELWNRSPFAVQSSPAACTAGTGRFLRRKIPFSRAKIVSLQFPRPKIRRILAETGRGARRPPPVAETGRSKPNKQGSTALIGGREAAEASRGARSARPVGETARSKPNEAGRAASELASDAERPCRIVDTERSEVRRGETPGRRRRHGAKMQDDHCELRVQ